MSVSEALELMLGFGTLIINLLTLVIVIIDHKK